MDTKRVQNLIVGVLFIGLFYLVCKIFSPFFTVILWSALLYIMFLPLYRKATARRPNDTDGKCKRRRAFFAGIFSLICVVVIVGPFVFLAIELVRQSGSIIRWVDFFLDKNPTILAIPPDSPVANFFREASAGNFDIASFDIKAHIIKFLQGSSSRIFSFSTTILKDLLGFGASILFMIFTIYFFFMDGDFLLNTFMGAIPIKREYMRHFVDRFKETARHLFRGYFIVALYQGSMTLIIFAIFRVKGFLLLALLAMFSSFIPIVGSSLIWLPVGLARIASGRLWNGILMLILSAFFISLMDNFLRPMLLKDKMNMHPLLIFFSILGGLSVFGFNGLVLGPIIVMLFFTVLEIFKEIYNIEQPKTECDE
jgi:predicted PurR-regulated permease PerM